MSSIHLRKNSISKVILGLLNYVIFSNDFKNVWV